MHGWEAPAAGRYGWVLGRRGGAAAAGRRQPAPAGGPEMHGLWTGQLGSCLSDSDRSSIRVQRLSICDSDRLHVRGRPRLAAAVLPPLGAGTSVALHESMRTGQPRRVSPKFWPMRLNSEQGRTVAASPAMHWGEVFQIYNRRCPREGCAHALEIWRGLRSCTRKLRRTKLSLQLRNTLQQSDSA